MRGAVEHRNRREVRARRDQYRRSPRQLAHQIVAERRRLERFGLVAGRNRAGGDLRGALEVEVMALEGIAEEGRTFLLQGPGESQVIASTQRLFYRGGADAERFQARGDRSA